MFIPGLCSLILRRDSFTMRHIWRRSTFRWDEIGGLAVVNGEQGPRVAWNTQQPDARCSALLRDIYGWDLLLPDNYGISAQELCAMKEERRNAVVLSSSYGPQRRWIGGNANEYPHAKGRQQSL
jgi:SpoVK/Ycf46/Vps4 family AAA+-type ATPase